MYFTMFPDYASQGTSISKCSHVWIHRKQHPQRIPRYGNWILARTYWFKYQRQVERKKNSHNVKYHRLKAWETSRWQLPEYVVKPETVLLIRSMLNLAMWNNKLNQRKPRQSKQTNKQTLNKKAPPNQK